LGIPKRFNSERDAKNCLPGRRNPGPQHLEIQKKKKVFKGRRKRNK